MKRSGKEARKIRWGIPPPPCFCASVTNKEVIAQKCAISALAERTLGRKVGKKTERGGYPIPGIWQSVRKWLNAKEFDGHCVLKCEESVRKQWEVKELNEVKGIEEAELPFAKYALGKEAAVAASRRFIRDAKTALRRG